MHVTSCPSLTFVLSKSNAKECMTHYHEPKSNAKECMTLSQFCSVNYGTLGKAFK